MDFEAFESAELSNAGRKRQYNEDTCLRLPRFGIYCVADGMGGIIGGNIASEAVTNTLLAAATKLTPQAQPRLSERIALFKAAINHASKWIRDFASQKAIGQMGTTVVALIFDPRNPSRAVALHAGDSRLYRFQAGNLEQLTADHTTAAALAARLGCRQEDLPIGVQNELTRAVGLNDNVELDQTFLRVRTGDLFLLCSDGLTRMVSDAAICELLFKGAEQSMTSLAESLVTRANEAGGKDNITVVLVRVGEISAADQSAVEDDWETVEGAEQLQSDAETVLAGVESRLVEAIDTPLVFEGETPTTETPTPDKT